MTTETDLIAIFEKYLYDYINLKDNKIIKVKWTMNNFGNEYIFVFNPVIMNNNNVIWEGQTVNLNIVYNDNSIFYKSNGVYTKHPVLCNILIPELNNLILSLIN